jgi:hypothetical protein
MSFGRLGQNSRVAPYKEPVVSFFSRFSFDFAFVEICGVRHFKFFNFVLTKNIEISSSFFRIFYFKKFQIHWPVYRKLVKPVRIGFSGF